MELTVAVMTFIIFIVSMVAWALIGLVFWIPILTRATTVFSGMILYATLTGQKADALRDYLRLASGFYANGFRITTEALYPPKGSASPSEIEFHLGRFIVELLWTSAFWFVVFWISKPDLITPLTARIWSTAEWFQQLVTSFQVLTVAIVTGVVFLLIWGAYLWHRFDDLSRSNKLSFEFRDRSNKLFADKRANDDRQLERIWRSLQEVSVTLQDLSRSSVSSMRAVYHEPPSARVGAAPDFPIAVDELLRRLQDKVVIVKRDFQNDMLVSAPDGKGELVLMRDSITNEMQTFFMVPTITKFQMRQDYYNFYEKYYECHNPESGAVWIVDPAVVEKVAGGWKLREKGRLEVR